MNPTHDLVLAQPAQAARLVLLFHGVGAAPADMAPLGQRVAQSLPDAAVVCVAGAHTSDVGPGFQWFSVRGVTVENRPARVAAAMPAFLQAIARWQQQTGVPAGRTALVGFSQGAIMSLESTQAASAAPAGRVLGIAGMFAQPVRQAPAGLRFHLMHGLQDGVIPPERSTEAHAQLTALGAAVTLDPVPGLGHGIDARVADHVLRHLAD